MNNIMILFLYALIILIYFGLSGFYFANKIKYFTKINFILKGFIINLIIWISIWILVDVIIICLKIVKIINYSTMYQIIAFYPSIIMAFVSVIIMLISVIYACKHFVVLINLVLKLIKQNWIIFVVLILALIFSQSKVLMLSKGYTDDWLYVNTSIKNYHMWQTNPYHFLGKASDLFGSIQHFLATFQISLQVMFYQILLIKTSYMQVLFNYVSFNLVLTTIAMLSLAQLLKYYKINPIFIILGLIYMVGKQNSYVYRILPQMFYPFSQVVLILLPIMLIYFTKRLVKIEFGILASVALILHPITALILIILLLMKLSQKYPIIVSNWVYFVWGAILIALVIVSRVILHKSSAIANSTIIEDEIRSGLVELFNNHFPFWNKVSWILCLLPFFVKNKQLKLVTMIFSFSIIVSNSYFLETLLVKVSGKYNFLILRTFEIIYFYLLIILVPLFIQQKVSDKKQKFMFIIMALIVSVLVIKPSNSLINRFSFAFATNVGEIQSNNLKSNPDVVNEVRTKISANERVDIFLPFDFEQPKSSKYTYDAYIKLPYVFDDTFKINRDIDFGFNTSMFFYNNEVNALWFKHAIENTKSKNLPKFIAFPSRNEITKIESAKKIKKWNDFLKRNNYILEKHVSLNLYQNFDYFVYKKI